MKVTYLAVILALAAPAAFANDHLTQIRDTAGKVGQEFRDLNTTLKDKNFDVGGVQNRVNAIDADIERLKQLTAGFEAAKPSLTAKGEQDWKMAKDLIQLIDIFHEQKSQLLSADPAKKRSQLRVQSEGLAKRAFMLQETSVRLLQDVRSGG